jgi:hypothetical protein
MGGRRRINTAITGIRTPRLPALLEACKSKIMNSQLNKHCTFLHTRTSAKTTA